MSSFDDFGSFIKIPGVSIYNDKLHGLQKRRKGGPNARQFKELESMKNQRLHRREFIMCSQMGSLIRRNMHEFDYTFRSSLNYELNGILKNIIIKDKVNGPGKRSLNLRTNGSPLNNYMLSEKHIDNVIFFPYEFNISEDRKSIKCTIPGFNPESLIYFPKPANTCKIFMQVSIVSDFNFNEVDNQYKPVKDQSFTFKKSVETGLIPGSELCEALELNIDLNFTPEPNHALIVLFGLEFSEEFSSRTVSNKSWGYSKIQCVV